ncbi:MFS transporter [Streptomyces vilmorinianum]|uniref:MFS transporter n=1 Tax=Streptomyces vilmorinianum TaxID=3051092 RepID=UPI0020C7FA39|nr:MFS transporter [Streptomyces vilmorinianum]
MDLPTAIAPRGAARPRTRPVAHPNVLVMAVAGAVTVANIYFPQPLLDAIAQGLRVSQHTAGLVASAAQIGYALGILLLVPLADTARLRRLTALLLALTSGGLLIAAAAPNVLTLTLATLAVSTTTVLPQILTPVAAALAGPERRGRAVGLIGLGLTLGSTLSRTVSGAVSDVGGGWRTAYLLAAAATAALLFVVPRALPERAGPAARERLPYPRLLASLPRLFAEHREVRISALSGAAVFAAFSVFWATLAFHLAAPPLGFGPGVAGLFGLLSLPGALLSAYAGRLTDRHGARVVNAGALVCTAAAVAVVGFGAHSPVALVIGANLLVLGTSAAQVANQARIFGLGPRIAARVNTVFMLFSFGGGALGSLTAAWLYGAYGWTATTLASAGFTVLAALVVAATRRGAPSCVPRDTRKAGTHHPRSPQGETMPDLAALADEHLAEARTAPHGRSAHVVVHDGVLRQSVIALVSGTALDEHNAPPAASLQVLRGRVKLTAAGWSEELSAGALQMIPKERHGLAALEDAVVLLTAVND